MAPPVRTSRRNWPKASRTRPQRIFPHRRHTPPNLRHGLRPASITRYSKIKKESRPPSFFKPAAAYYYGVNGSRYMPPALPTGSPRHTRLALYGRSPCNRLHTQTQPSLELFSAGASLRRQPKSPPHGSDVSQTIHKTNKINSRKRASSKPLPFHIAKVSHRPHTGNRQIQ